MSNGDDAHKEIWDAINNLRTTTTRLEANLTNFATPREFSDLRVELAALNATLKTLDVESLKKAVIETVGGSVATKTDVEWLKAHFWRGMAALGSVEVGLAVALILHALIK